MVAGDENLHRPIFYAAENIFPRISHRLKFFHQSSIGQIPGNKYRINFFRFEEAKRLFKHLDRFKAVEHIRSTYMNVAEHPDLELRLSAHRTRPCRRARKRERPADKLPPVHFFNASSLSISLASLRLCALIGSGRFVKSLSEDETSGGTFKSAFSGSRRERIAKYS